MEQYGSNFEIPPEGIDTPDGFLYYPPKQGIQILFLIASFLTAILLGWIVSSIPGDLSDLAAGFVYFIFILIFFIGYTSWSGYTGALLFSSIKLSIIKTLFRFFVHKEKPGSLDKILPTREKLIELMVRSQKATKTFFLFSIPIGIGGGFITTLFGTAMDTAFLFVIVVISSAVYGYALSFFGRRGYLPFPEE